MKEWYLRQSSRDRIIVIVVGALTLAGLLYALLWYPVKSKSIQARQAIISKQETLQYISQAAGQLQGASATSSSERKTSDKAPYLLIDQVIREASLEPPERVEPSGSDGARVQFNDVEFDKLVEVLAELELYGLKISTMTISRKEQGMVSARFNMERG